MKPTQATIRQRVEELLSIRLEGATFLDARRYVAEKEGEGVTPWTIPEGGKPVSERTLWRYLQQTDKLLAQTCRESRKRLLRRHLAQRRHLYAAAYQQGDIKTALSVLKDEAELRGLYPAKGIHVTGKGGAPIVLEIKEEIVFLGSAPPTALANIVEEVVTHDDGSSKPLATDHPPAPGAAGLPEK
jgi:hypothetical protein